MSKVVIQGNANGTGNFTIAAPNSNTDRTFNLPDAAGTVLTTGNQSDFPAGSVLQVLQTVKTDTFSIAGTTPTTITGLTVDITPASTSSKFLILSDVTLGTSGFDVHLILKRNSTSLYIADTSGTYRPEVTKSSAWYSGAEDAFASGGVPVMYLDSPSTTSQITYGFTLNHYTANGTAYVNRTHRDTDNSGNYDVRTASSITVMEIAG